MVERRPDQDDRRVNKVFLTPDGFVLIKRLVPQHEREVKDCLSVLDPEDRHRLRQLLGTLVSGLQEASLSF